MNSKNEIVTFPEATTATSLHVGQLLEAGENQLRLEELNNGKALLRNIESNETKVVDEYQLVTALLEGKVVVKGNSRQGIERLTVTGTLQTRINVRQETKRAVELMLHKRAWIDALHQRGIDRIIDEAWVRTAKADIKKTDLKSIQDFSISTLAATQRELSKVDGDWSQLIPRFSERGGKGKARIDPRAEDVINLTIDQLLSKPGRVVKKRICQSVHVAIQSMNLALPDNPILMPGDMTIARRIEQKIPAYEISIRNDGRSFAKKKYRQNSFPRDVPDFPLLVAEYDDMDCEVFLIDEEKNLPVGRAYLTHGVCQATAVPLGFDLSHESRSFDSAMGAIANSLLPKDMSLPEFEGCKHQWNGYGAQGTIILDNAKYNFSKAMRQQSGLIGLQIAGARPYGPTEKRQIEYFNHLTKMDFCKDLPGYRGRKDDPDSVKAGLKAAVMGVKAFRKMYVRWVIDIYMNTPGIDGFTPRERWLKYFDRHSPAVRWSREEIALLRLRPEERCFRHSGGIQHLNLVYDSDEMQLIRKQVGATAKIEISIDKNDLSYIMTKTPYSRQLIRVPCTTDHRYTSGLTEYQQTLILKNARQRGRKHPSLKDMVESREEIAAMVEREARSTKMKKRQAAYRIGKVTSGNLSIEQLNQIDLKQLAPKKEIVVTALESTLMELESVPLELADEEWGDA